MTPDKSTGGRVLTGQLAPRHRIEDVEDHVWFEDRWMVASLCDE
jgi:hypothetical protein